MQSDQYQFQSPRPNPKIMFSQITNSKGFNFFHGGLSPSVTSPRSQQVPLHKVSATNQINFKIQGSKFAKPAIVQKSPRVFIKLKQ
jgi:hypothetical protein